MKFKRYTITAEYDHYDEPQLTNTATEDSDGEWVKYEDIKHLEVSHELTRREVEDSAP